MSFCTSQNVYRLGMVHPTRAVVKTEVSRTKASIAYLFVFISLPSKLLIFTTALKIGITTTYSYHVPQDPQAAPLIQESKEHQPFNVLLYRKISFSIRNIKSLVQRRYLLIILDYILCLPAQQRSFLHQVVCRVIVANLSGTK